MPTNFAPYVSLPLTSDGNANGTITVANTAPFRVGATVTLSGSALTAVQLVVADILSPTTLALRDPTQYSAAYYNCNTFTVSAASVITQPQQIDLLNVANPYAAAVPTVVNNAQVVSTEGLSATYSWRNFSFFASQLCNRCCVYYPVRQLTLLKLPVFK